MRELPACPVCASALSLGRVLADGYESGGPDSLSRCSIDVSCAGCLSAVRFEAALYDGAPIDTQVLTPGVAVTRFRDAVLALRERGALEAEIPALLADPVQRVLVGVPEIASEILALGVRHARIAKDSYARSPWHHTPWAEAPWELDRFPEHIDDAQQKSALRDGEFGGFVVPGHGARVVVLALQKFQIVGFYGGKARLALPRVAERRLGKAHPGFQVPWEQLVPDRARRTL